MATEVNVRALADYTALVKIDKPRECVCWFYGYIEPGAHSR